MLVVVTGLPRSGTSMVMRMLAAGGLEVVDDGGRAADASNPHGYFEDARVRRLATDSSWLAAEDGRAVKVIAPLLHHLPAGLDARILLVDRDLEEVLASQARMLERLGRRSGDGTLLRAAFVEQLRRARAFVDERALPLFTLRHSRALTAPAAAAAELREFLALELDEPRMAAAVDPALYRERG